MSPSAPVPAFAVSQRQEKGNAAGPMKSSSKMARNWVIAPISPLSISFLANAMAGERM